MNQKLVERIAEMRREIITPRHVLLSFHPYDLVHIFSATYPAIWILYAEREAIAVAIGSTNDARHPNSIMCSRVSSKGNST